MAERQILFSAPMVRALLAGTKTQTRREVSAQTWQNAGVAPHAQCIDVDGKKVTWYDNDGEHPARFPVCPYGQPGDRLWVKETWEADQIWDGTRPLDIPDGEAILYTADDHASRIIPFGWGRGRPSIFMRRWMSRITLELTGVRVERLNDINEEDALAEGMDVFSDGAGFTVPLANGKPGPWQRNAVDAYRNLWEVIYGAGSWSANPWVWVLAFKQVEVRHA